MVTHRFRVPAASQLKKHNCNVSSKLGGKTYAGLIENGRNWVDDMSGTVARPRIVPCDAHDGPFAGIDQGTSITVRLRGDNIRPRNLSWYQATTAQQWLALLRIMTPVGGIHLDGTDSAKVQVDVVVVDQAGIETSAQLLKPEYLYPHTIIGRSGSIVEFLKDQ